MAIVVVPHPSALLGYCFGNLMVSVTFQNPNDFFFFPLYPCTLPTYLGNLR